MIRPLGAVLGLALVLRLAVACWPAFNHPDEIWQYLEPARHVVGKAWVQSWEQRAGARGWLVPVAIAPLSALGQWLAPGTFLTILLPRLLCALLSLAAVIGARGLGDRLSRTHALAAAFVAAIWYELVYFGPRTLTEPIATALILLAAWLLQARRALPAAGLLLGLACAVRFQYAPAAFVLAAMVLKADWRGWTRVIAGGLAGLAVSAAADLAMGAVPFAWVWRNLSLNLVENRSADYGTDPAWWYLVLLARTWGLAAIPVLAFAALGARRYPALAAAALVNLLVHAAIPHKEARFILLTTALAVVLAAVGSVDWAARRQWRRPRAAFAGGWLLVSVLGAVTMPGWGRHVRLEAAWRSAAKVPGLCGIGVYRTLPLVASRALLAREVPIHQYDDRSITAARASRAFNVLVAARAHKGELLGYRAVSCSGTKPQDLCVAARAGGCLVTPADRPFEVQAAVTRAGV